MAKTELVELRCIWCKQPEMAASTAKAVLCAKCVSRLSDPPPTPKPAVAPLTHDEKAERKKAKAEKKAARLASLKTKKKGKGRGFHLKQLAEFEGDFYSFGKKIGDAEVAKLRKKLKAK